MSRNKEAPLTVEADPLSQFHMDDNELRLALIKAQYELRDTRQHGQATGLLVLINGMELSGKGAAVTQLRQWVDPRLLNVEATIGHVPAPYEPIWQAHVAKLPRHGGLGVYFGNWYADLITGALKKLHSNVQKNVTPKDHAHRNKDNDQELELTWDAYLRQQLHLLSQFEADLKNNQTQLLKCWFHIDAATLTARLKDSREDPVWLYQMDWLDDDLVNKFNDIARIILSEQSDWIIIDGNSQSGCDKQGKSKTKDIALGYSNDANRIFCHHVLQGMQDALVNSQQSDSHYPKVHTQQNPQNVAFSWADVPDKLTDIDDHDLDKSTYNKALVKKQTKLAALLRDKGHHHVIFAFEGMDAAGKGGAIKRVVSTLDPREYQIYNIGAPNEIELQHPYLWRFWTRLPQFEPALKDERLSRVTIFDRTWYGRVLVERIEGFASDAAWQRAYDEINRMERDLAEKGTIILKYWLAIDKQEQLERFEDRKVTPHKQYKLTDDDWRNRDKWQDYVQAAADMLARTNSKYAPWHVVATNDKRTARLAVLDHAIKQLQRALS